MDLRLIPMVFDEQENLVGVGIMMPSLSRALRRGRGARRFWGYLPLAWTLFVRRPKNTDLLLVAVKPEYQGKGVSVLMFKQLHENCIKRGVTRMIMNPQLEENFKVQTLFEEFKTELYTVRRAYVKQI